MFYLLLYSIALVHLLFLNFTWTLTVCGRTGVKHEISSCNLHQCSVRQLKENGQVIGFCYQHILAIIETARKTKHSKSKAWFTTKCKYETGNKTQFIVCYPIKWLKEKWLSEVKLIHVHANCGIINFIVNIKSRGFTKNKTFS